MQLEVSEGETGLLRKKVDNLLTENLKLTKEIRGINTQHFDEKKKNLPQPLQASFLCKSPFETLRLTNNENGKGKIGCI